MTQEFIQSDAEIKRLKQQLLETEQAYHLMAEISKFKAGFLARIAHEIRSPLARAMNLNQAILSDLCLNPAEERDFLQRGQQALCQLNYILDEVITISDTANCSHKLERQNCDLKEILEAAYEQTYLQAISHGITIKTIIPISPIYVYADYHRLLHAITLLIDNIITLNKTNEIILEVEVKQEQPLVSINLDFSGELNLLSEPIDLIENLQQDSLTKCQDIPEKINISFGSKLHLIADLLESMGGKLITIENCSQKNLISLQCLLEQAIISDPS